MSRRLSQHGHRLPAAFAAVVLLGAIVAPTQTDASSGGAQAEVANRWRETLAELDRRLLAGDWKPVRKRADYLLDEMINRIERGPGAAGFLATAVALRGIAQAGLGNERDAAWDWQMATSLNPEYEVLDLSGYGQAGAILDRHRNGLSPLRPHMDPRVAAGVKPPRKKRAPRPSYPLGKRFACLEEAILIQAVIDVDGVPVRPQLLTPAYPVLGFAAMDVLRRWRFEPARRGGEAIRTIYKLTVNYSLPLCGVPAHSPPG